MTNTISTTDQLTHDAGTNTGKVAVLTHPTVATPDAPKEAMPGRKGRGRIGLALGALVVGGLIGTVVTLAVTDEGQPVPQPAGAIVVTPNPVGTHLSADAEERWSMANPTAAAMRITMTADGYERWYEASRQAALEHCTSSPSSADAIERCLAGS